jgi:DNA modification methylase
MEQLKWETKKVKVKDLIQLDINPRKISEDKKQKLVESLEKFNLVEIPAVNTDLQIIGGNQRVTALLLVGRGEEEIDVRFPNRKLTKKEVKEYAIISNTHAGEFDFEILDLEFADISIGELGFEIEGWDDWKNKQDTLLAGEAQEDDFNVPVGGSETDIVLGDLFEIGEHRLLCGDSTDSDQVAKLMNGEKADIMVSDPPYGIDLDTDYSKMGATTTKYEKIKGDEKEFDLTDVISISGTKEQYIWGGDYFVNSLDWMRGTQIIWAKRHSEEENKVFGSAFESLWVSYKCKKVIWFIRPINQSSERLGQHPTQKPIECMSRCIEMSKLKGIIYDAFLGSGSTIVASHQLKRKCYGMELDPKYCQVIIDRMIKLNPSIKITKNGKEWNTTKIS